MYTSTWENANTCNINENQELLLISEKFRFIYVFKGVVVKRGHIFKFLKIGV